jgi:aryl-alcohol dehydrogenase-like predicted oxidoreductase
LGVKNAKQMEENIKALDWQLEPKQKEEIDNIFAEK